MRWRVWWNKDKIFHCYEMVKSKIFFCLLFVSRKFCSNIQKDTFAYKGNVIESHSKFSYGIHSAFKQKESAYFIAA